MTPRPLPPSLPRTAWLEIDLDALTSNFTAIQAAVPPGTEVKPVVKGDAYGHGAVAVSRALEQAGARELCVATYDEAVELRQGGIRLPILILFAIPPELTPDAARQDFALTVGDATLLERTLEAIDRANVHRRARLHVEVETGLGRGGFHPEDLVDALARIRDNPGVRLAGLWSHLQAANDAARTAGQTDRFEQGRALVEAVSLPVPKRHMAASGGVLASTSPAFDAVRVGLALYGIVPDALAVSTERAELAARLRPVMALRARPIRVAVLGAGTGVSYGPSFVTARESRIGTLPIGYADGFPRSLSNRAQAIVRGMRVPLVGTVAMDAVMVDVTDVPGPSVSVDDEFTLLGAQDGERIEATEMARWGNTISYEVVTSMSRRLPRVYYAAARPFGLRTLAEERRGRGRRHGESGEVAAGAPERRGPVR